MSGNIFFSKQLYSFGQTKPKMLKCRNLNNRLKGLSRQSSGTRLNKEGKLAKGTNKSRRDNNGPSELSASLDLCEVHKQMKFPESEIIYGIYPVLLSLLKQQRTFNALFYKQSILKNNEKAQKIVELCRSYKIPCFPSDKKKLTRLVGQESVHQGVCLEATRISFQEFDNSQLNGTLSNGQFWIYLDQIHDPVNLGAILRSAYYLGVDKIFSSKINSCPLTSVVSKASSGVMEIFPVYHLTHEENFFSVLSNRKWSILASCTQSNSSSMNSPGPQRNILLVLGNEGRGISAAILEHCNGFVTIPPGRNHCEHVQSLNVSVASAVLIYALMSKLRNSDVKAVT